MIVRFKKLNLDLWGPERLDYRYRRALCRGNPCQRHISRVSLSENKETQLLGLYLLICKENTHKLLTARKVCIKYLVSKLFCEKF